MDTLNKLILELYRAAKETPVEEFQELALSLIKTQFSFRTAMWGACETTGNGLVVNSVHLHNEPLDILQNWTSLHRHDPVVDMVLADPGRAKIFYTPDTHRNSPDLFDFMQHYGHTNIMVIADMARNHCNGNLCGEWVSLYRADKHAHFTQADRHTLEHIMPHLIEALAINRTLGADQFTHNNSGLAGTRALARMDGTLYHCGKIFSDLLREIWPELKNGRLPESLMTTLSHGNETMLEGHNIAVSSTALGNLLMLSIRRVSPLSKLSPRELAVARFFGQGKSHKEIALHLDIAPSTARNFLSSTYKKLNINDKAELAALIRDNHS